jgi:hypothetical protein
MSSTSSELGGLGLDDDVDFWKRLRPENRTPRADLLRLEAVHRRWGAIAVSFASFAGMIDNLNPSREHLGSIFYGTLLGLFAVAFFVRRVSAVPVLIAAVVAQGTVISFLFFTSDVGFLWYNVIGCGIVVVLSSIIERCAGTAMSRTSVHLDSMLGLAIVAGTSGFPSMQVNFAPGVLVQGDPSTSGLIYYTLCGGRPGWRSLRARFRVP